MIRYKIFLIEDRIADAAKIIDSLNDWAKKENDEKYNFCFKLIKGKNKEVYEEEDYLFYDETVIKEMENHIKNENNNCENHDIERTGLLLDILLTKEDLESNLSNYYPQPELAKKIYFKFYKRIPVYMITSFSAFAIQSDVIMGVDLSEKYIAKDAILRYKIRDDIHKMFDFYRRFKLGKDR